MSLSSAHTLAKFRYTVKNKNKKKRKGTQFDGNHAGARVTWICLRDIIAVSRHNSNSLGFSELQQPPLFPINVRSQRINHWGVHGVRSIATSHGAVWALWRHVFTITLQSSLYREHGAKSITSADGYSKVSSNENARIGLRHMACVCEWETGCLATAKGCNSGSRVWRQMFNIHFLPFSERWCWEETKWLLYALENYVEGGGRTPLIHNLSTGWWWVGTFTLLSLYSRWNSRRIHWIGDRVGPSICQGILEKNKIPYLCLEPNHDSLVVQ